MRYFLFIDESGDHGLANIDVNFPIFVLCGVLFGENEYSAINEDVKLLKNEFWGEKKVILHSRDIRKCDKEFSILLNSKLKENFYKGLNIIVVKNKYSIIASCIDKPKHIKKYGKLADNVYEIALSFIIERAIFLLDDYVHDNEKSLYVIIEKRGKKEDGQLLSHFQKIKSRGTGYVNAERLSPYNINIRFLTKNEDINGLQIADIIAYPIARHVIDKERANPAFDLIKDKFYTKNGKVYGLKIFP